MSNEETPTTPEDFKTQQCLLADLAVYTQTLVSLMGHMTCDEVRVNLHQLSDALMEHVSHPDIKDHAKARIADVWK